MEMFQVATDKKRGSKNSSYLDGIIASVVDNIQIKIKNVYFRVEDDVVGD